MLGYHCRPAALMKLSLLMHKTSFTDIPLRSLHIITWRNWISLREIRNPAASRPWTCPDALAPYSGDGQVDWPDAELGEGIRPVHKTILKI